MQVFRNPVTRPLPTPEPVRYDLSLVANELSAEAKTAIFTSECVVIHRIGTGGSATTYIPHSEFNLLVDAWHEWTKANHIPTK